MKALHTVQENAQSESRARWPLHKSTGLIIREKEPRNFEFPFDRLDSYLTPVESFYVRSHFSAPNLQAKSYRLSVDGEVKNPFAITYDELKSLPAITIVATLECAGNSRVFLVPPRPGAQWELGAVGTAEWTGVPLRTLLDRAGLTGNACDVVLEGGDLAPKVCSACPTPQGVIGKVLGHAQGKRTARQSMGLVVRVVGDVALGVGAPCRVRG